MGAEFMFPYVKDKSKWPYQHDVMYWDEWPVRQPFLLFAGKAYNHPEYIELWKTLEGYPETRSNPESAHSKPGDLVVGKTGSRTFQIRLVFFDLESRSPDQRNLYNKFNHVSFKHILLSRLRNPKLAKWIPVI